MIVTIEDVVHEAENTKTLYFDKKFDAKPGQFLMVWIPRISEKPMAFSSKNSITVKIVGNFTKELCGLKRGDRIGVRGPFGRGFEVVGEKILIVGGGIGVSPLKFLGECIKDKKITSLLGFKTLREVFFEEEFRRLGKCMVSTDDGSYGRKGLVTDFLEEISIDFDSCYVCGPEAMMKKVSRILKIKTQFLLERYFKCGIGICGSCDLGGKLVCLEGPCFWREELSEEFGSTRRDESGARIKL